MSDTDADKKRNKLGYQRISVACGHCRRRKIRCVMAEGDAQNRCQNCIRLQKQCIFYPVDQPLPSDKAEASRRGSSSNAPSAADHTPVDMASSPLDIRFQNMVPVPSNAPQDFSGYENTVHAQGESQERFVSALRAGPEMYQPQPEYFTTWPQAEMSSIGQPIMDQGFLTGPVATYPHYPMASSAQSTPTDNARSMSFPLVQDSQRWQQVYAPPGRAMSFGPVDHMQATTFAQNVAPGYIDVPGQSFPQGFPPHLDMHSAMLHQMSGPQSAPAGMQMQPFMTPTTPQGYPSQGEWYGGQEFGQHGGNDLEQDRTRRTQR